MTMIGSSKVVTISILVTIAFCGVVNAQPGSRGPAILKENRGGVVVVPQSTPSDFDARGVRAQVRQMFTQYPPSLLQVLQLDPTLLTNETYLAHYPALASYFSQHPEIAHNPGYFLGVPDEFHFQPSIANSIARALEPLAIASVFIVLIAIIGWIIRAIMNHRRWLRVSKLQTDMQNKLLERFSSNEEMLAFIQTPAGRKFLESASVPPEVGPRLINAPIGRILWSIQLGIITLVAGGGIEIVAHGLHDEQAVTGFVVAGILVIALGLGFILSAIGSYILSRRLGLLEQAPTSPS